MKKILALFITLSLMFSLVACGEKPSTPVNNDNTLSTSTNIKHTSKKISGEITGASVFSDGLAFVCLDGNNGTTYCVNRDGYIVFELDKNLAINGVIYQKFINGYTLIDGGICDTKGKIVYPEEVGVTKFYNIAFEGGYVVAEKVTSDYSNTKKELGIMDMNFEWVIQPSEELHNAVGNDLLSTEALNTKSFYCDDFIYFAESKNYLNLKSGEISSTASINLPSHKWQSYSDNTFKDYNKNIIVDLREHKNIVFTGSTYKNGKAPIKFYNQEASANFFTLINEKGEFLFEPIKVENISDIGLFHFDGENVLIADSLLGAQMIQCYNSKGELMGELNTKTLEDNSHYSCDIGEGIITVYGGSNISPNCYYFNTDFTPLF